MSERYGAAVAGVEFEPRHLSRAAVGSLAVGLYATWMAADLVGRWLVFPAVAVLAGALLYGRDGGHEQLVFVGYAFAVLLAVTPAFVVLPDVLADGLTMLFMTANLLLVVLFALPAAAVAYVTYRVDGGRGVVQRVRDHSG